MIDPKEAKRFEGTECDIKGGIYLLHNSGVNVEIKVWFSTTVKKPEDFIWMFFNYNKTGLWKTKSFQFDDDEKN